MAMNCAEATAAGACASAVVAGRLYYIDKKCDWILPGSIARGSEIADAGHKAELAIRMSNAANCGLVIAAKCS